MTPPPFFWRSSLAGCFASHAASASASCRLDRKSAPSRSPSKTAPHHFDSVFIAPIQRQVGQNLERGFLNKKKAPLSKGAFGKGPQPYSGFFSPEKW